MARNKGNRNMTSLDSNSGGGRSTPVEALERRMRTSFDKAISSFHSKEYGAVASELKVSIKEYELRSKQLSDQESLAALHQSMVELMGRANRMAVQGEMKGKPLPALRSKGKEVHEVDAGGKTIEKGKRVAGKEFNLRDKVDSKMNKQHDEARKEVSAHGVVMKFVKAMEEINPTGQNPELRQLVGALLGHSKYFTDGIIDLKTYKVNCNSSVGDAKKGLSTALTREPRTILEHITNAIRVMFNLLDRMVTYATGAKQSMDQTHTPGAKFLTGRDHFFNRPETGLGTELRTFSDAIEKLGDIKPSSGSNFSG